jgi:hypothetical protein
MVMTRLLDDLSDDGDLAVLAEYSHAAVLYMLHELNRMSVADCNAHCRGFAQ